MNIKAALAAAALLAACSPEPTANDSAAPAGRNTAAAPADDATPKPTSEAATPALAIDGEGLRLFDRATGSARPIPFGTERDAAIAALAFRGAPTDTGTLEECGAGRLDTAAWPDDLTLYFQDGEFTGWFVGDENRGALTTASGIGVGSTRADLESAYSATVEETTIGTEFIAGGVGGLLDGKSAGARITDLWAGTTCIFR